MKADKFVKELKNKSVEDLNKDLVTAKRNSST